MEIVYLPPRLRAKRDHRAIAYRGRSLVERLAHPECEFLDAIIPVDSPPGRDAIPFRIAGDAAP
jgi:hypothetical protein